MVDEELANLKREFEHEKTKLKTQNDMYERVQNQSEKDKLDKEKEKEEYIQKVIEDKKLSQQNLYSLDSHLKIISEPFVDVELAILKDLNTLVDFCKSNYLS